MSLNFFENLSINYLDLLDDNDDFNTVINVGKSPNFKIFKTHSAILKCRSLYFRNELANPCKDENNIITINLNHVTIQQFEIIIRFIYGGVVLLKDFDALFIFELMLIAYELLFEELAKRLEIHLIVNKASWLLSHFARIYKTCSQNNKLQDLLKWCNNIMSKYPNINVNLEDSSFIQKNILVSLVGSDDLQMDEYIAWDYLIKWGMNQNPNLPSNPENWSQENFLTMKSTLQNCLHLINYFQISGANIIRNAQPYQQILEKNLWKDIMKRLITPIEQSSIILPSHIDLPLISRNSIFFSTVITYDHAAEISSWIDGYDIVTYSVSNNPYEFKLLLRGSRNGFTTATFWNLCNKKANVIVVMKVKGTDEILGGYNPIGWDKSVGLLKCKKSFIFSLKNGSIQNSILSRVKISQNELYSIYCDSSTGPCFYSGIYMLNNYDQSGKCYYYHNHNDIRYERRIRNTLDNNISEFSVEEYEIFQIHKKKS